MTNNNELKLAEALRERSATFAKAGDLKNALLDIGACFYLLQNCGDGRLAEVHAEWAELYQRYGGSDAILALEGLLSRVKANRAAVDKQV